MGCGAWGPHDPNKERRSACALPPDGTLCACTYLRYTHARTQPCRYHGDGSILFNNMYGEVYMRRSTLIFRHWFTKTVITDVGDLPGLL